MIKEIHGKNFQSHRELSIKLSPGVNVFLGESDSGKTAIIRLLRWIVFNDGNWADINSWWGGQTEGGLVLDDGKVERLRTKSINRYILNGNSKEPFEAFGVGVPDEIQKLLRIPDLALQQQMDSPFLLADSPPDVARRLNQVARLDVIDDAMSNAAAALLTNSKTQREVDEQASTMETKLAGILPQFDALDGQITEMTQTATRLQTTRQQRGRLQELFDLVSKREQERTMYGWFVSLLAEPVKSINLKSLNIRVVTADYTRLYQLYNQLQDTIAATSKAQKVADCLSQGDVVTVTIPTLNDRITTNTLRRNELASLVDRYEATRRMLAMAKSNVERLTAERDKLMPDVCPLCKTVLKKTGQLNSQPTTQAAYTVGKDDGNEGVGMLHGPYPDVQQCLDLIGERNWIIFKCYKSGVHEELYKWNDRREKWETI